MNVDDEDYARAVSSFYEGLYRFAFSLAGNADDACEPTQESEANPARPAARRTRIRRMI
jgi:hypothetical protein